MDLTHCVHLQACVRLRLCEQRRKANRSWLDDYLYGFEHVIYVETMSDAFVGMTFTEAVELVRATSNTMHTKIYILQCNN